MKPTWCTCDHWGLSKGVKIVARRDVVWDISLWQKKKKKKKKKPYFIDKYLLEILYFSMEL
jgi:hypothetical protein